VLPGRSYWFFINHFRPYLLGKPFMLRTDHGSLVWLQNFKQPEGQLARWLEKLQEYDFTILHRSGNQHGNADALSRRLCSQCQLLESVSSAPMLDTMEEFVTQSSFVAATNLADGATTPDNLLNGVTLRRAQLSDDIIKPILEARKQVRSLKKAHLGEHPNKLINCGNHGTN